MAGGNVRRQTINADGTFKLTVVPELDDAVPTPESQFDLKAPGVEGYVIGRADVDTNYAPDVDLTPFDAMKRGISRRHAALVRYRGQVHIIDLGSMNGTFVNGERLAPQNAYALHSGDRISLANLEILISQ
ncbi:MAG: FHA domain-containing protein [Chloroflexota bacterium]